METHVQTWPLTHPQKRIWLVGKIFGNSSIHHLMALSIKHGEFNLTNLEEAIHNFVKMNEGTRLIFVDEGVEPVQYVGEYKETEIPYLDFSHLEEPELALERWAAERANAPLLPDNDRLFAFIIVRLDDRRAGFLFFFHHLIADGWSLTQMMNRIWHSYETISQEIISVAASPGPSYVKYIETERNYMNSSRFRKNRDFWLEQFRELPKDMRVRNSSDPTGNRRSFLLPAEISKTIKAFAASNVCSVNTLFVMLVLLYLHKSEQKNDLIIGTPVMNRSGKKEKEIFGMFTSTVPFRCRIDEESSLLDMLTTIQEKLVKCYFNQKYPYELLLQDLELRKKGFDGLFDVCVNYYNTSMVTQIGGDPVVTTELYGGSQPYALQIVIKDWREDGALLVSFDYQISEYSDLQIEAMWEKLNNLIGFVLTNGETRVADLEIVTAPEREQLLDGWNRSAADYPSDICIHRLIEEQTERTPDRIAIRLENDRTIAYRDLNAKANQLAHHLRERGVSRNSRVGLMATHSEELLVGLLAILKAGGAYVPIAPDYPPDRVRYILQDSEATILLSDCPQSQLIDFGGERIDLTLARHYYVSADNPVSINEPTDLAYILYTSGSTGKPKGVMVGHRGLVNYISWARKQYVVHPYEAFALYSSISFDLTVTSIFTPLVSGNPIHIYKDDGADFVLHRVVKDNKTHIIKLTPSHLSLLRDIDLSSSIIRRFIVGGEDFKTGLAREIHQKFGGRIDMFNEYGPTETVVGCMIYRYDYELDLDASVPIGHPADNVRLYVLDERLKLLPVGSIGELYISGDGVAHGYVNRSDLTKGRFLDNPFIPGMRMYKTGDLARYRVDGVLEYLGRRDHQIKIRGYRIELGEVESRLNEHPAVSDCVVLDGTDEYGSVFLCAYYVADRRLVDTELRSFLLSGLPSYMVPSLFARLKRLPLTLNGKVDRSALPEIRRASPVEEEEETVSESERERIIREVYQDVLNVKRMGGNTSFYQVGGDSIKAIQIASKLSEQGIRVKVKDILSLPFLSEVAAASQTDMGEPIADKVAEGSIPPTPITEWFFAQRFKQPQYWNQSILMKMKQSIDADEVRRVLMLLIGHHDGLRMNLNPAAGGLAYEPKHLEPDIQVEEVDLSSYSGEELDQRIKTIGTQLKSGLRMDEGLPIAACLFIAGADKERLLLMTAHHLVVDAVSWRILLDDFAYALSRIRQNESPVLLRKTHSYKAWATKLQQYADRMPDRELGYWTTLLTDAVDAGKLLPETAEPPRKMECMTVESDLTEDETAALLGTANETYLTETKELLILALAMTVRAYTNNDKVLFELEGHGREELFDAVDLSRTVGWFTSMFPFLLRLQGEEIGGLVKEVKERLRAVPNNGVGYGIAKYLSRHRMPYEPAPSVRFNYLGEMDNALNHDLFEWSSQDSGSDQAPDSSLTCLLDVMVLISRKRLKITATSGRTHGQMADLASFADRMAEALRHIIAHCAEAEKRQFTPSDFDAARLTQADLDWLIG